MSRIIRDELLRRESIDKVILGWENRASSRILGSLVPVEAVNEYRITLEVDMPTRGGATPLHSEDSEPPMVRFNYSRSRSEIEAPMWAEGTQITPGDIENIRRFGTVNEIMAGQELLSRNIAGLEERLQNRFELMRREFIFDQVVTGTTADGLSMTFTYDNHPDFMNVQAANSWDDPTLADPIVDVYEWLDVFFEHSTYEPMEVWLPFGSLKKMGFIDQIRDKVVNRSDVKEGRPGADQLLGIAFNGVPVREIRDRITYTTQLSASASAGATAVTLYQVEKLAVGSKLTLTNPLGSSEIVIVSSISGKTVNFISTPLQHDYIAGAGAQYVIWTIPLDTMLIVGGNKVAIDTSGHQGSGYVTDWAKIIAPLHLSDDMMNPKSGLYTKIVDDRDKHTQKISYSMGGKFIPVQYNGTGFMKAQIFY